MKPRNLFVRSVVLPAWLSGLVLLAVSSAPVAAASGGPQEDVKSLIVMIEAKTASGDGEVGAGIIFGTRGNSLYIVTANHVVRQSGEDASAVRVKFWWLPGEDYEAKLLNTVDSELDLAVLKVGNVDRLELPAAGLPFAQLAEVGSMKHGDKVYLIGYPTGHSWEISAAPALVTSSAPNAILFEDALLQPGDSGGALLDEDYRVVGLLSSSQAPHGKAVKMQSVLDFLKDYPVDLEPRKAKLQEAGSSPAPTPTTPAPVVDYKDMDPMSAYAARGAILARDTSLATLIREREPDGPLRRGFDIGMGVCEGHTAWGPGKQKILDSLSNPEQRGFLVARDYSLDRNNNVDFAKRGAAIADRDPVVANARGTEPPGLYWLGFDIATGIFGDPALGAQGNTQSGPGSLGIRDKLSPEAQRGFNDSMRLHLSRNYRK